MKKRRTRVVRARKREHRLSVFMVSGVIVVLAVMLSVASISLHAKNQKYKKQEAELEKQLEQEAIKAEENEELEEYIATEQYIEDVAKEKLGLAHPNEIRFEAK